MTESDWRRECSPARADGMAWTCWRARSARAENVSVRSVSLRALAVAGILAAGCAGPPGAGPAPRQGAASRAVPVSRALAEVPRAPAAGAARVAVCQAGTTVIPAAMRRRMTGVSWHPSCPVGLGRLRLVIKVRSYPPQARDGLGPGRGRHPGRQGLHDLVAVGNLAAGPTHAAAARTAE
jgi:hypothetical protein